MTGSRRYGLRSLRFKLVFASVVVEVVMLSALVWNSTRITGDAIQEIFQSRVEVLVPLLNVSLANPLAQRDYATLEERLGRIIRKESLVYMEVRDELGKVVASRGGFPTTPHLDTSFETAAGVYDQEFDITLAGRTIGHARYGLNVSLLQTTITGLRNQGVLLALAEIVLTLLLLSTLGYLLTRRLQTLAQTARSITGGDFSVRTVVAGRDEIADTALAFNEMAATVERDIAGRQQAQQALRVSEERLKLALEGTNDGLWDWNIQSSVVTFSPRWKAMLGYAVDELADTLETWEQRLHPEDKLRVMAMLQAHFDDAARVYEPEFRMRHKNGAWVWIQARGRVAERNAAGLPLRMLGTHTDITERKQAQEALKQSEQRLRNIIDGLGPSMFVGLLTTEGVVLEANQQALAAAGLKPEDVLGKLVEETYWFSYSKESKRQMRATIARAAQGEASRYDLQIRATENQFIPLDFSVQPFRDATGRVVLLVPSGIVIAERKQAEANLHESEERLRLALDAAHMGTFDWDVPHNHITWSYWHEELWGFQPGEFGGTYEAFSARVHSGDLPGINAEVARCIAVRAPFVREFRVVWPDGSIHWIAARGEFTFGADGQPLRMRGAVLEITERKQAEEALRENALQLQMLSKRVIEAQEIERRRLAGELHDELGQALTAIKINLQARGRFKGQSPEALDAENIRIVDDALLQVRRLALALRPSMLDDLGLGSALRWMADQQAERGGFVVHFGADFPDTRLAPELETTCFRIAQEALTNIARHAQAKRVAIELRQAGDTLVMAIHDDGRGFDVAAMRARATAGASIGLLGMKERATLAGGSLDIESSPKRGTILRARFPWRTREEQL